MGNHVHLLLVPAVEAGMSRALAFAHQEYARWVNLTRCRIGHLWQNRYYSCVLDEAHQWEALRYVELNPVRAGLTCDPAQWQWSSAIAHLTGWDALGLLDSSDWQARWSGATWRAALDSGIADGALAERIREATRCGRPMGDEDFVARLEDLTGRRIRPRKPGRPRKELAAKIGD